MRRLAYVLVCSATAAFPQCSMCRTVAAAQSGAASVFDSAILVLFVPALAVFSGTLIAAFRFRSRGPDDWGPD
jgi:hypothetical protein